MIDRRLTRQLLAGAPAADVVSVVERLLAVQAQDWRGFHLALRARTAGLTAADVDSALTRDRSLVVDWLNRGTLHLVHAHDHAWLHALTTPQLHTGNATRLAQEGVRADEAEAGVRVIRATLDGGPATREELRGALRRAGVRTEGQAFVHLLARASFAGEIVRGPVRGAQQAFVLTRDWLPAVRLPSRERMLGELARRYLAGHGPAAAADLAYWAGIPLAVARAGLREIQHDLTETSDGLVDLRTAPQESTAAPPRLLGVFDPVLHGWRSRSWVTGQFDTRIATGGLFRAFALADGRAAALWRLERGRPVLEPLRRLRVSERTALLRDADDVVRFLGERAAR